MTDVALDLAISAGAVNIDPLEPSLSARMARAARHRRRLLKIHRTLYEAIGERGRLPPAACKLLQVLLRCADPDGVSWFRLRRMGDMITRSARRPFYAIDTLRKAARLLRSLGLLSWARVLPNAPFPSGTKSGPGGRTWTVEIDRACERVGLPWRPLEPAALAAPAPTDAAPPPQADTLPPSEPPTAAVRESVGLSAERPAWADAAFTEGRSLLDKVLGRRRRPAT